MSPQNAPSQEENTHRVINNFNEAFNRHDADALAALLTDDTVFEETRPLPPTARRIVGKAVASLTSGAPGSPRNADAHFDAEEVIVTGNPPRRGPLGHHRKTPRQQPALAHRAAWTCFTVRNGKVAAKLAYVKG